MPTSDVSVEMFGLPELERAFDELGKVGTKQVLTGALRKAVKPVADEANRIAPIGEDQKDARKRLAGSFVVRTTLSRRQRRRRPRRGFVTLFVGSNAPHAHLVEFGHAIRSRGPHRKGAAPQSGFSFVSPRPILRPALDMHRERVMRDFGRLLWSEIVRVAKRYRGQAERGKLSRGARVALGVGS